MKIFLDSANIEQIKTAYDMGAITGVTTNPSIISRENRKFDDLLTDITAIMTDGPVFAEVLSVDAEGMIEEGRKLAAKSKNIVVKIPMIPEGLKAVKTLSSEGITVCNTVVFSSCQAILAANAGARYVSPFVGRFDDIGEDGISELANVVTCIQNYDWTGKNVDDQVEIITASVRTPNHVTQAALMGADIATVPFGALKKCLKHPLTDQGMASFDADWAKVVAAQ